MQEEEKPTGIRYAEEDKKKYASQAHNYSTWKEAGEELGPDYKSLRAWCIKYSYPFPKQKEIKNTEPPVKDVQEKTVCKKKIKNFVVSKKLELSGDLKEGIVNMVADHLPEKTISRLTGIPKDKLREVMTQIMRSIKN